MLEWPDSATDLLVTSVDTARALRSRNYHAPEPGSSANLAWVRLQIPDDSLEFFAFSRATSQLGAAEDNIAALAQVLREGEVSIAPYVLARAVLEACGRAFVLLDPGIAENTRTELLLAERQHELSTLERLMLARSPMLDDETVRADVEEVRAEMRQLKREARRRGLTLPQRPSFTDVLKAVLKGADGELAMNAAVRYSSLAHAVPEMLIVQSWRFDESLDSEWNVGFAGMSESDTTSLVLNVLSAYSQAVSRQIEIYGWPPSAWLRWMGHVRATFRRASEPPGE